MSQRTRLKTGMGDSLSELLSVPRHLLDIFVFLGARLKELHLVLVRQRLAHGIRDGALALGYVGLSVRLVPY